MDKKVRDVTLELCAEQAAHGKLKKSHSQMKYMNGINMKMLFGTSRFREPTHEWAKLTCWGKWNSNKKMAVLLELNGETRLMTFDTLEKKYRTSDEMQKFAKKSLASHINAAHDEKIKSD